MGLDIYLYRYEDKERADHVEEEFERRSQEIWDRRQAGRPDSFEMTEIERASWHAAEQAVAEELGMVPRGPHWWEPAGVEKIEFNSALHPDHYCKVGYLRSSYNESGFNRVVGNLLGQPGFYELFDYRTEAGYNYKFRPDWQATKVRAQRMLAAYDAEKAKFGGNLPSVARLSKIRDVPDEESALQIYRNELAKAVGREDDAMAYSNAAGDFWLKGLTIQAAIPGEKGNWYLIYYQQAADKGDWYRAIFDIVIETCDYVLAQPDPSQFWLHWSA